MATRTRISLFSISIVFLLVFSPQLSVGQVLLTPSEKTGFEEYTSYEDMMVYLQDLQATTTEMLLSDFGSTVEGRQQPYAVFSRPLITQPWEAMTSGKPIVVLAANIHGGERTVRESLLLIAREFVTPGTPMHALLDDLIIVMVPTINPDGLVRATRGNSQGVDMNRDWIKLEQPALYNYVRNILLTWKPHLFLDGHNGGAEPYNICYQGPANAAGDMRLTDLCDQEIFPYISEEMEANGYMAWYYSRGDSTQWRTAPTESRISINYGGMINSIAVLFESPRQDRETGALSGLVATRALVQYVADNAEKVMMTVDRARRETIERGQNPGGEIVVEMETGPKPYKVSYYIMPRGARGGRGGGGGEPDVQQPLEPIFITGADLMLESIPTKTRPWPYAYILEARAFRAIEMLKRQKVMIEVLQEDTEIPVEAYVPVEYVRGSVYDHPASVTSITVEEETVQETRMFPAGTYIIRTGQAMGRIITHVLEPETPDNVITWNTMDAILPRIGGSGRRAFTGAPPDSSAMQRAGAEQRQGQERQQRPPQVIPIFKLMVPTTLPTKILKY